MCFGHSDSEDGGQPQQPRNPHDPNNQWTMATLNPPPAGRGDRPSYGNQPTASGSHRVPIAFDGTTAATESAQGNFIADVTLKLRWTENGALKIQSPIHS